MEAPKRMSLNTSLKDANIFADDTEDEDYLNLSFNDLINREYERKQEELRQHNCNEKVKQEPPDVDVIPKMGIKQEPPDVELKPRTVIKQEPVEFATENYELIGDNYDTKCDLMLENLLRQENLNLYQADDDSLDINEQVEKLGLRTPVKIEASDDSLSKSNMKSTKRSLMRPRNSPYSKPGPSEERRPNKRERDIFYKAQSEGGEKRQKTGFETDPEVLSRRQKQIDFGKNTIGYDNFIKLVPKEKRTPEDPVTPNKYRMYSRRGFDGLIKQWRLKLHNYDP